MRFESLFQLCRTFGNSFSVVKVSNIRKIIGFNKKKSVANIFYNAKKFYFTVACFKTNKKKQKNISSKFSSNPYRVRKPLNDKNITFSILVSPFSIRFTITPREAKIKFTASIQNSKLCYSSHKYFRILAIY